MKKKKTTDIISNINFKEKILGSNKYPGFQIRMLATLIDFALVSILFLPLFTIIGNFMYGDVVPPELMNKAIKEITDLQKNSNETIDFLTFIRNTPEYNDFFFKNNGFAKMFIEQILQMIALCAIILVFWIKKQSTPGKMILSLKIVDATTLGHPTNKQFIIRLFSYIISIVPLLLGVLWIAFDKRKQSWHDKFANTLVIKVDKKKT